MVTFCTEIVIFLQCAILSPKFMVRDFSIADCQPYSVTMRWTKGAYPHLPLPYSIFCSDFMLHKV